MVDLISVNKFYRGSAVRNNQKNEKIEWKKPEVKTYGDVVEIIAGGEFLGGKDLGPTDGYSNNGNPIGS